MTWICEGEKILLDSNGAKQAGANAFRQQNWDEAIAQYEQAANTNANDPEGKIYLHSLLGETSREPPHYGGCSAYYSGVASYQQEFHQSPPLDGRLLEIVAVNADEPGKASSN